jgi:hypothetical protein
VGPGEIACGQNAPVGIAVDSTFVYWANGSTLCGPDGQVMRHPISGGSATVWVDGAVRPYGLALDASFVYWTDPDYGNIMRRALPIGDLAAIAAGQTSPTGIALDGTYVYWTNGEGQVRRALPTGADQILVASGQAGVGLAVDATYVYFTILQAGTVARAPVGGGGPVTPVATGLDQPVALVVSGNDLYVAAKGSDATATGAILRVGRDGTGLVTLAAGQAQPAWLAVDGTHVYWTNFGTSGAFDQDGAVRRAERASSGVPETLYQGSHHPLRIALDATHLYWTNYGTAAANYTDGTVMVAPKPTAAP